MPDQQQLWDDELLTEFRQKTRTLTATLRRLQQEESDAKKSYRSRKAQRKALQSAFDALLFADSGADGEFVAGIQQHGKRLSDAEENERAARQEWRAAQKKRQDAKYRLTIHIETFMAPVPLFDPAPAVPEPAKRKRTKK